MTVHVLCNPVESVNSTSKYGGEKTLLLDFPVISSLSSASRVSYIRTVTLLLLPIQEPFVCPLKTLVAVSAGLK